MKKRLFSLILCLIMLITAVPVISFGTSAAETEKSTPAEYDALYVQNGLTLLLDATDTSSLNLNGGTWTPRVGATKVSIKGGIYNRIGRPTGWQVRDGGIGYSMTKTQWNSNNTSGSNYVDISAYLPASNYTVEVVATYVGLTNADGTPYVDDSHTYGVYSGSYACFEVGALKATGFVCDSTVPTAGSSGQSCFRISYHSGYWSADNGQYWLGSSALSFAGEQLKKVPTCLTIMGTDGNYTRTNETIYNSTAGDKTPIEGASRTVTLKGVQYEFYMDGSNLLSLNTVTSTAGVLRACGSFTPTGSSTAITGYEYYLQTQAQTYIAPTGKYMRFMRNIPGVLYGIRVYSRNLTAAEMRQNHFADLCRILGVNVSGFSSLSATTKETLYAYAENLTLERSEKNAVYLQGMLDFYTGRSTLLGAQAIEYQGLQARLSGEPGVRALFRVDNAIMQMLESRYTVRYGAVAAIGDRDGQEVLTAEDVTVRDTGSSFVADNGKAVTVYSTKGDYGATGVYTKTDATGKEFAYTTYYSGAAGEPEAYSMGVIYRAFIAVTDSTGKTDIHYIDATGETFGAEDARYGTGSSLAEVADYFVNRYSGHITEGRELQANSVLRGVLSKVKGEVIDYFPGRTAERQLQIYVNPAYTGATSDGGEATPFRTLEEAYAKAKSAMLETSSLSVVLNLAAGTHRVSSPLTLEQGEVKAKEMWFTVQGEGATVTGNRVLTEKSWTKVSGKNYYSLQLSKDASGNYPDFRYLYVDGALADLAYSGYKRYKTATDAGGAYWQTGAVQNDPTQSNYCYRIYCNPTPFNGLTAAQIKGMEIHIAVEWEFKIMHIDHIDTSDKDSSGRIAVYIEEDDFQKVVKTNLTYQNRYYWLENSITFLDSPGEYFYDRANGKLYYYPKSGTTITNSTFEIPQVEQLFGFNGVDNVTFADITMTGVDNRYIEQTGYYGGSQAGHTTTGTPTVAAIHGENMQNLTIFGIRVEDVCGDGVSFWGGLDDVLVENSTFENIGRTAIRVGRNNGSWAEGNHLLNCDIKNNVIRNAAWFNRETCAIYASVAKNLNIQYNSVYGCSYTGVSVGWRWSSTTGDPKNGYCNLYNVDISYNYFEGFMSDMSDGGAIYTLGGNANVDDYQDVYFNYMHHNYAVVSKYTGAGKGRFMPLYHDGASSNWHSHTNVVSTYYGNAGLGSFYVQWGEGDLSTQQTHNLLVENNYFTNCDWTKAEKIQGTTYRCTSEADYLVRVTFWNHVREQYHVYQKNNHLVKPSATPNAECKAVMNNAGSTLD